MLAEKAGPPSPLYPQIAVPRNVYTYPALYLYTEQ
jgi:hypothetical protein